MALILRLVSRKLYHCSRSCDCSSFVLSCEASEAEIYKLALRIELDNSTLSLRIACVLAVKASGTPVIKSVGISTYIAQYFSHLLKYLL